MVALLRRARFVRHMTPCLMRRRRLRAVRRDAVRCGAARCGAMRCDAMRWALQLMFRKNFELRRADLLRLYFHRWSEVPALGGPLSTP